MIQSKQEIPRWIIRESEKNAHVKINLELESKISLICKYNVMTEHKIWMHFIFCIVCKPLRFDFYCI